MQSRMGQAPLGSVAASAACWVVAVAGATLLSDADASAGLLAASVGVIAAVFIVVLPAAWPLATVAAGTIGVVEPGALLPWTLAATAAVFLIAAHRKPAPSPLLNPEVLIARCRRLGTTAQIVVGEGTGPDALGALASAVRTTDGFAARETPGGCEIVGVIEGDAVDRAAVERRLNAALGGGVTFGWAQFPADGLTLEVAAAAAAGRMHGLELATAPKPAPQAPAIDDGIAAEAI